MENNKVTVKIFGQEYIIVGAKSREHILKVADYVDSKMEEMSKSLGNASLSSVAVLSALNVADEYFSALDKFGYLEKENSQFDKEIKHYEELWEESKKNHIRMKEEVKKAEEEKQMLKTMLEQRIAELEKTVAESNVEKQKTEEKIAKMENEISENAGEELKEMEARYKDLESSFFDIQMENIQLKGELDRYKKKMV